MMLLHFWSEVHYSKQSAYYGNFPHSPLLSIHPLSLRYFHLSRCHQMCAPPIGCLVPRVLKMQGLFLLFLLDLVSQLETLFVKCLSRSRVLMQTRLVSGSR